MGIFDKAKDLIGEHNEKIDSGIDQAARLLDERTGGQHADKITGATGQVKSKLDEFADQPVPPQADPTAREEPIAQPDPRLP